MKSKLSMLLTFVLILVILSPVIIKDVEAERANNKGLGIFDFLKAESVIELNYDKTSVPDSLVPGEVYTVPINISYAMQGTLAKLYSKLLSDQTVTIDLSVESGKYCEASINTESVEANITTDKTTISTKPEVTLTVNQEAVAYSELKITVIAKANEKKGPLGFLTYIKESDNVTSNIPIKPAYVPVIDVKSDSLYKEIPPFNVTKLSLNITNLGNGKTIVLIEPLNVSEHFNISVPKSIMLEINDTKPVIISVSPDNDFGQETLKISFTPSYYADESLTGTPVIQTYALKNDGSYKEPEDNDSEIDLTLLIVLIFVILIIIVFIYIIRQRL